MKHSLYQQFRILDKDYEAFVEMVLYQEPTQQQLDHFQKGLVLCPPGCLEDHQIYGAFRRHAQTTIMIVSRAAAQRINNIVVQELFAGKKPLTKRINENRNKACRIVNRQDATLVSSQGNTLILRFPDGEPAFVYPVTHYVKVIVIFPL